MVSLSTAFYRAVLRLVIVLVGSIMWAVGSCPSFLLSFGSFPVGNFPDIKTKVSPAQLLQPLGFKHEES